MARLGWTIRVSGCELEEFGRNEFAQCEYWLELECRWQSRRRRRYGFRQECDSFEDDVLELKLGLGLEPEGCTWKAVEEEVVRTMASSVHVVGKFVIRMC